ncbi:DMT family transporter [Caldalkalibacillus salinus]|uniref:DMT family transporter n=1 Tax=Caldalkalibacillus salinus TaxID=2803787 RepID=UPI00192343FB|nr:multidrug efflux SMR transporter [Caldalkalibacillus salinus]
MGWIYIIIGGVFEIGWVVGLKLSEGFTQFIPSIITAILIMVSLWAIAKAMNFLPMGTVYTAFTGIGTVGTSIIGMMYFEEPVEWLRLLFLTLLIIGIIGLKGASSSKYTDTTTVKGES